MNKVFSFLTEGVAMPGAGGRKYKMTDEQRNADDSTPGTTDGIGLGLALVTVLVVGGGLAFGLVKLIVHFASLPFTQY